MICIAFHTLRGLIRRNLAINVSFMPEFVIKLREYNQISVYFTYTMFVYSYTGHA